MLDEGIITPNHIHGIIVIQGRGEASAVLFHVSEEQLESGCFAPTTVFAPSGRRLPRVTPESPLRTSGQRGLISPYGSPRLDPALERGHDPDGVRRPVDITRGPLQSGVPWDLLPGRTLRPQAGRDRHRGGELPLSPLFLKRGGSGEAWGR